jgi:hypothetical protein
MSRIAGCGMAVLLGCALSLAQSSGQASGSASQSGTVSIDQLGAQATSGKSAAASGTAAAGSGSGQIQAGSIIYATLDKSVDAKKAKVGSPVVAKIEQPVLSRGKIVAPKDSKIIGHVTQVQARSKGQRQSQLGIVFDRVVLKNGSQIPVSFTVQAIGNTARISPLSPDTSAPMAGPLGGNPGMTGHPGGPPIMGSAADPVGDMSAMGSTGIGGPAGLPSTRAGSSAHVSSSSRGLVGIPDVTMATEVRGSSQSTLLTSDKRNVKLDGGAELVLRVQ